MKEILLYLLLIMIFYDFSLHFLEGVFRIKICRKKFKPYWPIFKNRTTYTYFWIIYWLIAFILLVVYLLV